MRLSLPARGGWTRAKARGRVGIRQSQIYGLHHAFDLVAHFCIRETQDLIPSPLQRLVANGIALSMLVETVLMTVDLHDEKRLAALEIDDIRLQRRLPPKMMANGAQFT